jgi:Ca-activated chloride channel family protein
MSFTLLQRLLRESRTLALACALVPAFPMVHDPVATGRIEGTVRDLNGAPIAGVAVTVDGTALSASSDARGHYVLSQVPAGTWTVRATLTGWRTASIAYVLVKDGTTRTVDIRLVAARPDEREMSSRDEVAARQLSGYPTKSPPGSTVNRAAAPTLYRQAQPFNTEDYHNFRDNGFLRPATSPLSTFAIDVDAASYSNVRRFLTQGQRPPADAVRVEELINYFPYDYPGPTGSDPFSVTTAQMPAPWANDHRLVLIGLQGRRIDARELPASNLVFLLDVSGSMASADKLPLVQRAFRLLVEQLRPQDRVAIVVYAGAAGLVLPSTSGADKHSVLAALDQLQAGGSTAGGEGIKLAYQVAQQNHIANGNNRVILATDGDFNVGVSSEGELVRLIESKKSQGTYLTVLGFGTGNLKDSRMEALADRGNGHYAYVDDIMEARKVFVQEMGATLVTIAKDAKIQVEFNPAQVAEYRLIGYENRLMAAEDFNDDTRDGGELGAGHAVTAIYEIVLVGRGGTGTSVDPLKYQEPRNTGASSRELFTVKLRYQQPTGTGASRLIAQTVQRDDGANGNENLRFAAAVAEYGMLLRNSPYKAQSNWENVITMARQNIGTDPGGYRAEFVRLAQVARGMSGGQADEVGARD